MALSLGQGADDLAHRSLTHHVGAPGDGAGDRHKYF